MDYETMTNSIEKAQKKLNKKKDTFTSKIAPHVFILLIIAFITTTIYFLPSTKIPEKGVSLRTFRTKGFPITFILEQQEGVVTSAWLRTPAGSREITEVQGMTFISDSTIISQVDKDKHDDLLWRLSFINFEGVGLHLWLGLTTWNPSVTIASTPYQYTRWDSVPAQLLVPKGTALYISPGMPSYKDVTEQFSGTDSYSFIYTIRMTPDGPAFVPLPSVYRQLSILLRTGIRGEISTMKRLAYVRMLTEFNNLGEERPPSAETMLNLQLKKIDTLFWKK